MQYAIKSDGHANEAAELRVMNEILYQRGISIENIRNLGDIVGYGPDVNECVELNRSFEIPTLRGNHDQAAVDEFFDLSGFNGIAQEAAMYARNTLTNTNKSYLRTNPYVFPQEDAARDGFECAHGSVVEPEKFPYVGEAHHGVSAKKTFETMKQKVLFVGHSHIPGIFQEGVEKPIKITEGIHELAHDSRYIVNVGSVGQARTRNHSDPESRDPRACFVIYDTDKHTVEYVRVAYDIKKTQKRLREVFTLTIDDLNKRMMKDNKRTFPNKIGIIPVETVGDILAVRLELGF